MATRDESEELRAARAAKPKAHRVFRRFGKVQAVGLTRHEGRHALKVNLEAAPADAEALPLEVDGVPVVVQIVGKIRKQQRRPRKSSA